VLRARLPRLLEVIRLSPTIWGSRPSWSGVRPRRGFAARARHRRVVVGADGAAPGAGALSSAGRARRLERFATAQIPRGPHRRGSSGTRRALRPGVPKPDVRRELGTTRRRTSPSTRWPNLDAGAGPHGRGRATSGRHPRTPSIPPKPSPRTLRSVPAARLSSTRFPASASRGGDAAMASVLHPLGERVRDESAPADRPHPGRAESSAGAPSCVSLPELLPMVGVEQGGCTSTTCGAQCSRLELAVPPILVTRSAPLPRLGKPPTTRWPRTVGTPSTTTRGRSPDPAAE